ncbi:GNAT family N-acetyltransferase [Peribacillus tepidiphilus]|uniref:GNAT family N-acetyltransferase n=1 Tax=Peribacillus tepidiphilus TaxID=2652445 RepID=UPI001292229F|nr:hypothetical protein [Peribacillus tepidiphilus]
MIFRKAEEKDIIAIEEFLLEAGVSAIGVKQNYPYFLMAEDENNTLIATIGIEPVESGGLLRSFVFSPTFPQSLLAPFFQQTLLLAKQQSLSSVYLASDKEASFPFFKALGFKKIRSEDLPESIKLSPHCTNMLEYEDVFFMEKTLH